jgi:tRNA G18 (ribose-2'-O)-methylase SpoU
VRNALALFIFCTYKTPMRRVGVVKKLFQRNKYLNETNATPGPHEIVIVLDGLKPDYNIGKIFRSADAFGVREIHLINVPFFNPSPARGSFKYVPAKFHTNFSSVYGKLSQEGYTFYVLEPAQHQIITSVKLAKKAAFVFGHEEYGVSFKKDDYLGVEGLSIPQLGRVQSLNVSIAASIMMFEYARQFS